MYVANQTHRKQVTTCFCAMPTFFLKSFFIIISFRSSYFFFFLVYVIGHTGIYAWFILYVCNSVIGRYIYIYSCHRFYFMMPVAEKTSTRCQDPIHTFYRQYTRHDSILCVYKLYIHTRSASSRNVALMIVINMQVLRIIYL